MAEALLRGILAAKRVPPEEILVTDVRDDRLAYLKTTYGIGVSSDNAEAARHAETVLLAVKPQVMSRALDDLRRVVAERQLVISIAAGISTTTIADAFLRPVRVIRVMPNTPALVLEGVSALARGPMPHPRISRPPATCSKPWGGSSSWTSRSWTPSPASRAADPRTSS